MRHFKFQTHKSQQLPTYVQLICEEEMFLQERRNLKNICGDKSIWWVNKTLAPTSLYVPASLNFLQHK